MAKPVKTYYVITYRDPEEEKVVTLKARTIEDSSLGPTFIAVSNFIFDTDSPIIDPEAESRKRRYENTKRLHLTIYHILSIEEVGRRNKGLEFKEDRSNILVLRKDKDD